MELGLAVTIAKWIIIICFMLVLTHRLNRLESEIRAGLKDMEAGIRSSIKNAEVGIRSSMKDMETGVRSSMKDTEAGIRSSIKDTEVGIGSSVKDAETGVRSSMKDTEAGIRSSIKNAEARIIAEMDLNHAEYREEMREIKQVLKEIEEGQARIAGILLTRLMDDRVRAADSEPVASGD